MMLEGEKRRDCFGDKTTADARFMQRVGGWVGVCVGVVAEKRFNACRYVQFLMWSEKENVCVYV